MTTAVKQKAAKQQKEIFIRPQLCTGCHSCELACAVSHTTDRDLVAAVLRGERPPRYIWVDQFDGLKAPTVCRQCKNAPCVTACPTGAMYVADNDIKVCDVNQCIGCWMCVVACPFGAIAQGDGVALKCSRDCMQGEDDIPACVRACPTGALVYMTVAEFAAERRRATAVSSRAR